MPYAEFVEFMVYEGIEPFGDRRGDVQAAVVSSTIANVNRSKPSDRLFTVADFMPEWEPKPVVRQTPQEQLAMMLMIQSAQNAKVIEPSREA